jgi:hypothetical protein
MVLRNNPGAQLCPDPGVGGSSFETAAVHRHRLLVRVLYADGAEPLL